MSDYDHLKAKYYYSECIKLHLCTKCFKPLKPDALGRYAIYCEACKRKARQKNQKKSKEEFCAKDTLCWHCKHAVPIPDGENYIYGCEWSLDRKPVKGWEAVKSEVKCHSVNGGKILTSYRVIKCPKFLEGRTDGKYRQTAEKAR